MSAVAPEAVNPDMIKPGLSPFDQQLNAKLAISTAHKMGARIFCGWQDIEARPKLMLSMMAAVMAIAFQKRATTKQDVLNQVARSQPRPSLPRATSSVASILSVTSAPFSRNGSIARSGSMMRKSPDQVVAAMRNEIKSELEEESIMPNSKPHSKLDRLFAALPSLPNPFGTARALKSSQCAAPTQASSCTSPRVPTL